MIHVDGGYHAIGAAPIDVQEERLAEQAAAAAAAAAKAGSGTP